MLNEIFKDIENYEGLYQVSNLGNIKSLHCNKERIMKPTIRSNNYQYYFVGLLKNGKRKYFAVHRLVAMAFIPNPNNYEQVDHLDGNKLNNNVDNLEWVSPKENTNRAWEKGLAKYTDDRKEKLRKTALEKWKTNSFRKIRGIKRTQGEKKEYQRKYYQEHKQFSSMEYRLGDDK